MAKHTAPLNPFARKMLIKNVLEIAMRSEWFIRMTTTGLTGRNPFVDNELFRGEAALMKAMNQTGYRRQRLRVVGADECWMFGIDHKEYKALDEKRGEAIAIATFFNTKWARHFLDYIQTMDKEFTYWVSEVIAMTDANDTPINDTVEVVLNEPGPLPEQSAEDVASELTRDGDWGSW